jgi:serine phosphatase RsbU (regulator of sigma subunit)
MFSSLLSILPNESDHYPQSEIYALVNTSTQHRADIRSLDAEVSEKRWRFSQQREIFNNRILDLKEMLVAIDIQERLLPKIFPGRPLGLGGVK